MIISVGAFILITGLILFVLGPSWVGLLVALIVVLAAVVVRAYLPDRRARKSIAGDVECPHCGSLQTDEITKVLPDGSERITMHCFSCGRDFGPEALPSD